MWVGMYYDYDYGVLRLWCGTRPRKKTCEEVAQPRIAWSTLAFPKRLSTGAFAKGGHDRLSTFSGPSVMIHFPPHPTLGPGLWTVPQWGKRRQLEDNRQPWRGDRRRFGGGVGGRPRFAGIRWHLDGNLEHSVLSV